MIDEEDVYSYGFEDDVSSHLPPQNIEAEEAILGGILIDSEAITRIGDQLRPEFFYVMAHQEIYRACITLHSQSCPTDLMSVSAWLNDRNLLEKVGGQSKLVRLCDATLSAVNIDYYAQIVAEKYTRRKLSEAGREIINLGQNNSFPLSQVLDSAEQKIFAVTQSRNLQGLTPAADILTQAFFDLENRYNTLGETGENLPGITTGFYDLDAMTQGLQRSDLIIIAGRPSMGKCLSADSEITLTDGSVLTIEELYQLKSGYILTLNNQYKLEKTRPSNYIDDGIKPVFKLTTKLGKQIKCTASHPFLTLDGWRKLIDLKVGDRIALPRIIPIFGNNKIPECQVKILAYLIGDGSLTKTTPCFTNNNYQIQKDFQDAIAEFSQGKTALKVRIEDRVERATSFYVSSLDRSETNCLTSWLHQLNLYGKDAHQKYVPPIIFTLDRDLISLFLNRLFSTDGWATVLSSGQSQIGYSTVSEKLARQIQHLLLRFGIISKLKKRSIKYLNELRNCWQIDITDSRSLEKFIIEIDIFSKEAMTQKILQTVRNKRYQTNTDLIPINIWEKIKVSKGKESWSSLAQRAGFKNHSNIHAGRRCPTRDRLSQLAVALEDHELYSIAHSDIYWDQISAITFVGEEQVYDLTIPYTQNFIANDICVHNTAFGVELAKKIAEIHHLPVAIYSLEMSKEQLVYRLLSSQTKRPGKEGIDSHKLRSGQIRDDEWTTIAMAVSTLSELPIYIDDTPNPSINELRSKSRRLQIEKGGKLGLILIDYLQLMEASGSDNRVQELSRITRSLKGLARELQVPIVALSQLSRGVEARNNKRPMLSDLRESGSIEQDADIVIMLYRDEYYNPDTPDRGIAEIIIAKHRNGPTGTIKLIFDPRFTKFENSTFSRNA